MQYAQSLCLWVAEICIMCEERIILLSTVRSVVI